MAGERPGDVPVIENCTCLPTIHVISDSVGSTAKAVARAAASQFGTNNPNIEVYSSVDCLDDIIVYLENHAHIHKENLGSNRLLLFYTLVDPDMRAGLGRYLQDHPNIVSVDILSAPLAALSQMTGKEPADLPGELYALDQSYFKRIEAMEFTISHDDGRNPQDLPAADIVLLGVSRCSKTPTSIYLSQLSFKVANIPLDLQTEPPTEIYQIDSRRIFGLTTTPDVLLDIRRRRLGKAVDVASDYANPEMVYRDLEHARALMRKLGCIVVNTANRAIEETAQEILRYYMKALT